MLLLPLLPVPAAIIQTHQQALPLQQGLYREVSSSCYSQLLQRWQQQALIIAVL